MITRIVLPTLDFLSKFANYLPLLRKAIVPQTQESLNDELRMTDELLKLLDDFRCNPYTAKQIEAKFGSQAFHLFGHAGVGPEVLQKFQKVVCYS